MDTCIAFHYGSQWIENAFAFLGGEREGVNAAVWQASQFRPTMSLRVQNLSGSKKEGQVRIGFRGDGNFAARVSARGSSVLRLSGTRTHWSLGPRAVLLISQSVTLSVSLSQ